MLSKPTILAHKIQLLPTKEQEIAFCKAAGCARYTWNWALEQAEKHYKETKKFIDFTELKKRWNQDKPEWVYESPSVVNQRPFSHLKRAYANFFESLGKRGKRRSKPKFKKKGSKDSFYMSNITVKMLGNRVRLSSIGKVKLAESLRFPGKVMSATVSRTADRWFISIQVETQVEMKSGDAIVGVDLGLKTAVVTSDDQEFQAPKPLKANFKKLKRLSKQHSRKQKGSKNREKSKTKLARLHAKIANIRKDFLHKTTSKLCARAKCIVIEDLNVQGMLKNRKLARAIQDVGFYEFRRQLEYKCKLHSIFLVTADRFFPSSKRCSGCGRVKASFSLGERVFNCEQCGLSLDRDLNAARNLYTLGYREIYAYGHNSSGSCFSESETVVREVGTRSSLPESVNK